MKKTRENKGITLIALIITIIVMLILVGVSVNVALNGGLFDTTKTATEKTNEAVQVENDYMAYVQLIAEADELVERYPLNCVRHADDDIGLKDRNILDLYGYILEKYDTTYENLSYATAIKAANNLYEIYKGEVQANDNEYVRMNFWSQLSNPLAEDGIVFNTTATSADYSELTILQLAFMFSKNSSINGSFIGISIMDTKINNVKHYVIGNPNIFFDANSTNETIVSINTAYNNAFPGGHFPVDEITGTAVSDYSTFDDIRGRGEICVLTEEIANSDMGGLLSGNKEAVDPKDYIGHMICLLSEQETGTGKVARIIT